MTQTSGSCRLLEKLQLQNRPLLLIGCPRDIKPLFKDVVIRDELPEDGAPEAVLAFVTSKLAAEAVIHAVLPSCTADTLLWFAYPKQSSKRYTADISQDSGWAALSSYDYEPVTQISIDADWSALRFRPHSEIGQPGPDAQDPESPVPAETVRQEQASLPARIFTRGIKQVFRYLPDEPTAFLDRLASVELRYMPPDGMHWMRELLPEINAYPLGAKPLLRSHHLADLNDGDDIQPFIPADGRPDASVPALEYQSVISAPPVATQEKCIIYHIHGGGFIAGLNLAYRHYGARLARESGVEIAHLDYRIAPDWGHPTALIDALVGWDRLIVDGWSPEQIILMGDSAGANLCCSMMLWLRDHDRRQPRGAVLMSPWLDLSYQGEAYYANLYRDPMFGVNAGEGPDDVKHARFDIYPGGSDVTDPYLSPVYGDFRSAAPLAIQTGTWEMLYSDATWLRDNARSHGVPVLWHEYPEMFHTFQIYMGALSPESREAWEETAEWIRQLAADPEAWSVEPAE